MKAEFIFRDSGLSLRTGENHPLRNTNVRLGVFQSAVEVMAWAETFRGEWIETDGGMRRELHTPDGTWFIYRTGGAA